MIDKLRAEALALPTAERAELAFALLESLESEFGAGAPAPWLEQPEPEVEVAVRSALPAVSTERAVLVDWNDARARAKARSKTRSVRPIR